MDFALAGGGLIVGFVVGLTGMGGGALMTPMLVVLFNVDPLAAVSSDLVASALMKPFGGAVHMRRGTVNLRLVAWLAAGSVPSAFAGVFVLRAFGDGQALQDAVKTALGVALLIAAASLTGKAYIALVERVRRRSRGERAPDSSVADIVVRPIPTLLVGVAGGLIVGMTSVGSGSLIIIALLALYPRLQASQLVGTDLVQAVPLVAAAAVGHLLYGDFQFTVAASLLVGAIPGVIAGAHASSKAPAGFVRRALALVLLASGLKLVGVGNGWIALAIVSALLLGPVVWMQVRRTQGLPALARRERDARRARRATDRAESAAGQPDDPDPDAVRTPHTVRVRAATDDDDEEARR